MSLGIIAFGLCQSSLILKIIKEHDVLEPDLLSEMLCCLLFFRISDDGRKNPAIPNEISCFLYCEDSYCGLYVMMQCSVVGGYQHLRETYCLKFLS
jgi:hypothetical protein